MSISLSDSRVKSYLQILKGTCDAEAAIIKKNVEIRKGFEEISEGLNDDLRNVQEMGVWLNLPVPPPPEGSEPDPAKEEERAGLKVALGPIAQAIQTRLNDVANLEDEFDNASRKSLSHRRNHTAELQAEVEKIINRTPAVKNLSPETIKEIKDIVLKSPEEIKAAVEKLDPSNTAGLKELVNAIATELNTLRQELSQRRVKISDKDMTLFSDTSRKTQALEREAGAIHDNIKDITKTLEQVSRDADARVQKGSQAMHEKYKQPKMEIVRARISESKVTFTK